MDEDEEFAKRFALKPIKPDERMHQIRYVRRELVEKIKAYIRREKRRWKRRRSRPMEE